MSKLSIILTVILLSLFAQAENCLQGTVKGKKNLAQPWPLAVHGERHTQIQRAISAHARSAQSCLERFGDLPEPIEFLVPAGGELEIDNSSLKSPAAECLAKVLSDVRVGNYSCDMNVPYKWNGKFPLVNTERRAFQ